MNCGCTEFINILPNFSKYWGRTFKTKNSACSEVTGEMQNICSFHTHLDGIAWDLHEQYTDELGFF